MSVYTGSCLCGSVTYEAEGEPRRVFECYCNWCQKITGGSARAYAVFDMGFNFYVPALHNYYT